MIRKDHPSVIADRAMFHARNAAVAPETPAMSAPATGWVMVPVEPTDAMLRAVDDWRTDVLIAEDDTTEVRLGPDTCAEIFAAMLDAAPAQVATDWVLVPRTITDEQHRKLFEGQLLRARVGAWERVCEARNDDWQRCLEVLAAPAPAAPSPTDWPSEEAVERAAKAMWEFKYARCKPGRWEWAEACDVETKPYYRDMARAALAAAPSPQVGRKSE